MNIKIPDCFICPVSQDIMRDPVNLATDCGHSFDRESARQCLSKGLKSCPVCRRPIRNYTFFANHPLREAIEHFESSIAERTEQKAATEAEPVAADEQNENSSFASNVEAVEVQLGAKAYWEVAKKVPTIACLIEKTPKLPTVNEQAKLPTVPAIAVIGKPPKMPTANKHAKVPTAQHTLVRKSYAMNRMYSY